MRCSDRNSYESAFAYTIRYSVYVEYKAQCKNLNLITLAAYFDFDASWKV